MRIQILALLLLTGCVKLQLLPYLDQVLILEDLGKEKDRQELYIKNADAKFDQLREVIARGEIEKYKTQADIVKAFGEPILKRQDEYDGSTTQFLYRYTIHSKGPHKVWLYFDANHQLIHWDSL